MKQGPSRHYRADLYWELQGLLTRIQGRSLFEKAEKAEDNYTLTYESRRST